MDIVRKPNEQDDDAFDNDIDLNDFEYERRFFCQSFPKELDDGQPLLIIQSYYVHRDNYALRIRMIAHNLALPMNRDTDALAVLEQYRDNFSEAFVTVKGPANNGTRYEAERDINIDIAAELILRGGVPIIKNRYNAWIGEDGWSIDVFGGDNAPLIVAEAERSGPVTDLVIPDFCITEITNEPRFANDSLAERPYKSWEDEFSEELRNGKPQFLPWFGQNRHE